MQISKKSLLFILENLIRCTMCVVLFFTVQDILARIIIAVALVVQILIAIYEFEHIVTPLIQMEKLSAVGEMERETDVSYVLEQLNNNSRNAEVKKLTSYMRDILLNSYDSRMLRTQAEMRALQNQINPHFLYNTLENIRSQAVINDCEEIAKMTEALSTLFRYSISGPSDMVTVRQELENTDNYLAIQKMRFPGKFTVNIEIENTSVMDARLPILTIQPLVENAIHHGLETMKSGGSVRIRILYAAGRLKIIVTDNGCGIPTKQLEVLNKHLSEDAFLYTDRQNYHAGIALYNINRRIRFYYGEMYGLTLYSTEGVGTSAEIELPFETENSEND